MKTAKNKQQFRKQANILLILSTIATHLSSSFVLYQHVKERFAIGGHPQGMPLPGDGEQVGGQARPAL